MTPAGFPHSDISGSKSARDSPELFAACHVLHRLLAPRHPPRALCSLTSSSLLPGGQSLGWRSIGIISFLRLGEIEDSFNSAETIQLSRCDPPRGESLAPATTKVEPSSSDPLVGGLPHIAEGHGSGVRIRDMVPSDGLGIRSGMGPDLF